MVLNFNEEKNNRKLDKKIFFKLTTKEREIYNNLKKRVDPERIILSIGDTFSKTEYRNLTENSLIWILSKAKSNAVEWERKMDAAEDFLTAVKKSDSNPKMIYKIFFSSGSKNEKPFWELTRTMYSIMGIRFFNLTRSEVEWINSIGLKNKYASEWEIIDPLFNILDTTEGHEFIEYMYECRKNICNSIKTKIMLNKLIDKSKEYKNEMKKEYIVYETLLKEKPRIVIGLIEKCMDVYWITHLFYVLKNGNYSLIKDNICEQKINPEAENRNEKEGNN